MFSFVDLQNNASFLSFTYLECLYKEEMLSKNVTYLLTY